MVHNVIGNSLYLSGCSMESWIRLQMEFASYRPVEEMEQKYLDIYPFLTLKVHIMVCGEKRGEIFLS